MTKKQWLLSFNGRINRSRYWLWILVYYAVLAGAMALANMAGGGAKVLSILAALALMYPDMAVQAKRWHDRNKSSWWLLMNVPLFAGRVLVPTSAPIGMTYQPTGLESAVSLVALVCGAWILIECGLLKGKPEANQYGEAVVKN